MLLSHLPAGYINTYVTKGFWSRGLSKAKVLYLLIIGTIFGLLPDLDIIYYYLFNAEVSHRELISHSPFPYIVGAVTIYIIGIIFKSRFVKALAFLFFLSPMVHLLLDITTAGIPLFYPFSNNLYGLLMIPALDGGVYGQFIYVFLYGVELAIILVCVNILIYQFVKKRSLRMVSISASIIIFFIIVVFLFILNINLYPKNSLQYYNDQDNDGIINMRDEDINGNSINNIIDHDADSDGISNREDLIIELTKMEGVRYDYTEDTFFNILSRFGMLSSADLILKSHDMAGIFLGNEMRIDREKDESKYNTKPEDEEFNQDFDNIYTFYKNNNYLISSESDLEAGDIIFWGTEEKIEHVSIIYDINEDGIWILYGNKFNNLVEIINIDKYNDFEKILSYGKIIK